MASRADGDRHVDPDRYPLANESEAQLFEAAIDADPNRRITAASVLEAPIVATARYGDIGGRELDLLLNKADIEIAVVTSDQVDAGRYAFSTYGKGRHLAALNFGDCFSYAVSKTAGEPLLFRGSDFSKTDIAIAPL
jgi:ribonuclease VapC